jgi:hypothetical protein
LRIDKAFITLELNSKGTEYRYRKVLNTIPVPGLVKRGRVDVCWDPVSWPGAAVVAARGRHGSALLPAPSQEE